VPIGGSETVSGVLALAGEENYFQVSFTGANNNCSYHPKITLTTNPNNEYQLDILKGCGSPLGCGTEGGTSTNVTDWEVFYTAGVCPSPEPIYIPPVGNGGTVIFVVHRVAGGTPTCDSYTVTISD
jgi:hypothetical protein